MNLIETDRLRYSAQYYNRKNEAAPRQIVEDWVGAMNDLDKEGRLGSAGSYKLAAWELFNGFEEHVLYQDDDILVVNKPAWVISGSGDGVPEAGVVEIAQYFAGTDVVLMNRLDRPTSGVIILAKNEGAFAGMSAQFDRKTAYQMSKVYRAILEGQPRVMRPQFIDAELMPVGSKMKLVPDKRPGVLSSRTMFNPLLTFETASGKVRTLAEFELFTGRTHQIRVVAAQYLGFPVCGDALYGLGGDDREASRLMLHSFSTTLMHPKLSKELTISAPLPRDFVDMLPSGMSA